MLDTLTKIPSQKALEDRLKSFSHPKLMLIDLKNFKELNLNYSDSVGDFVLKEFAKNLQEFARKNDMEAFRVIEDEFALLKDMPFDLTKIEKLLFSVVEFVKKQSYMYEGNHLSIEAHIGLCLDQTRHLNKAKKALSVAQKEDQPFVTYSDFVNRLLEENKEEICKLLQTSLDSGSLMPYYQKVVDKEQNTIYYEMLLRNKIKDTIQTPKLFLKIAHERGFYNDIVKMVSKKIDILAHDIAINLSAKDFFDEELFSFLISTYKDTNTIFELQNDEFLKDNKVAEKIKTVKQNNIKICLDNVSNKENLNLFDLSLIDFVKICGSQTRLITLSEQNRITCKEIISTCKDNQIKTIASHITSKDIYQEAKELEFDYFQGYFIDKPTSSFAE